MTASEYLQKAARKQRRKGKAALDKGDIQGAFAADDRAVHLGVRATFLRMRGR